MSGLQNLTAKLAEATAAYRDRQRVAQDARRQETDALNALNEAQREFDKAVAAFRKDAPNSSDWQKRAERCPTEPR